MDFGPAARNAADFAARFAESVGARLVLVHVMPAVSVPASWSVRAKEATNVRTAEAHQQMCAATRRKLRRVIADTHAVRLRRDGVRRCRGRGARGTCDADRRQE